MLSKICNPGQIVRTLFLIILSQNALAWATTNYETLKQAGSLQSICHSVTHFSDSYQECLGSGASSFKIFACGSVTKKESFLGCLKSTANPDQALACHQATNLPDTYLKCLDIVQKRNLLYVEILYCDTQSYLGASLIACLSSEQFERKQ